MGVQMLSSQKLLSQMSQIVTDIVVTNVVTKADKYDKICWFFSPVQAVVHLWSNYLSNATTQCIAVD